MPPYVPCMLRCAGSNPACSCIQRPPQGCIFCVHVLNPVRISGFSASYYRCRKARKRYETARNTILRSGKSTCHNPKNERYQWFPGGLKSVDFPLRMHGLPTDFSADFPLILTGFVSCSASVRGLYVDICESTLVIVPRPS